MGRRNHGVQRHALGGWGAQTGDWGPKGGCLGTHLQWPRELPLAFPGHLHFPSNTGPFVHFRMCRPFLSLCVSSTGCFLKHVLQFLHNLAKDITIRDSIGCLLKTFCSLTTTYVNVTKTWHSMLFPICPSPPFPAPLLPLPLAFPALPTHSAKPSLRQKWLPLLGRSDCPLPVFPHPLLYTIIGLIII